MLKQTVQQGCALGGGKIETVFCRKLNKNVLCKMVDESLRMPE